jgi:hypothetical protein
VKAPAVAITSRALAILLLLVRVASADTGALLRGLDTDDPRALSQAVAAIEQAPTTPDLADVLFAAGRVCEDRLLDPARALALYDRIVRELPDASVAIAAARRIENLRDVRGHEFEARALAELMANADKAPAPSVIARGRMLGDRATPWLADWLCRKQHYAAAQSLYTDARAAAGCAIEAHDYALAKALATRLPDDDTNAAIKRDLLTAAARGQLRVRIYDLSWIVLVVACIALLASAVDAMLRGGFRAPALRPPVEVLFLAPLAIVVAATTYATQRTIWPAVVRISLGGIALTWLSGLTLDLLRARHRSVRARALLHVLACAAGVLAIGYISVMRDGLIEMFVETLRYGPEH